MSCQEKNKEDARFYNKSISLCQKQEKDEIEDEDDYGIAQKLREEFDREIILPLSAPRREKYLSSDEIYLLDTGNTQKLREHFGREIIYLLPASNTEKSQSPDEIYPLEKRKEVIESSGFRNISTAKTIIDRNVFPSKASGTGVTERNQMEIRNRFDRKFVYIDTPDNYGIASNEIRIVAIGKTGSGKSATANTIAGRNVFESKASSTVVTTRCQMEIFNRFDNKFVYVDTPGIFDPHASNEKDKTEIVKCIGITAPGPHAFLYVVSIGTFTKEDQDAIKYFVDYFGTSVYKHLIVVFTRIDDLDNNGMSIEEFIKTVPDKLKEILDFCDNRYIGFNNRLKEEESHLQVQLLLDIIDSMVKSNDNQYYTNYLYNETEDAMRKRLDEIKKELEEKKKREEEAFHNKMSKQYKKEISKYRENEERMKIQIQNFQLPSEKTSNRAAAVETEISDLNQQLQSAIEQSNKQFEKEIIERILDIEMQLLDLDKLIKNKVKEEKIKRVKKQEELNRLSKQLGEKTKPETERDPLEQKLKQLEEEKIIITRKEREKQKSEKEEMARMFQLSIRAKLEYLKTVTRLKEEQLKWERELEGKHKEELNQVRDKTRKEVEEENTDFLKKIYNEITDMWTCHSCQRKYNDDTRYCIFCRTLRKKEEMQEFLDENETGNVQKLREKFYRKAGKGFKQEISERSECLEWDELEREQQNDLDSYNYGIESNEMRMVAIGKTGTGRSATANTIVGRKAFESKAQGTGVTTKCQMEICNRFGKKFVYVDTPGIFSPRASNEKVKTEIVKCIGMTAPGPHVFLYVVSISRFTKEDQDAVQYFLDHFGTGLYKYLIVVFTRIDDLDIDGISMDEFVKDVPDELKEILRLCDNRYIGFNNRLKGKESHLQVQLLLDKIDSMIKSNGNQYYTNAIYNKAEKAIRNRLDEMKKELEETKKREEEALRKTLSKQYEKEVSKSRENEERMKMQIKKLQLESQNISTRAEGVKIEISHLQRQLQFARERSDTQSEKEIIKRLQDMEMKLSELEKQIKNQHKEKEMKTKKEEEELNQITKQLKEEAKDKTEKEMLEKKLIQLEEKKIENIRKERERQKAEKEEKERLDKLEKARMEAELENQKTVKRLDEDQLKRKWKLNEKHKEDLNRMRDKTRKEVEEANMDFFTRMFRTILGDFKDSLFVFNT